MGLLPRLDMGIACATSTLSGNHMVPSVSKKLGDWALLFHKPDRLLPWMQMWSLMTRRHVGPRLSKGLAIPKRI